MAPGVAVSEVLLQMEEVILPLIPELLLPILCLFQLDEDFPAYASHSFCHWWEKTYSTTWLNPTPSELAQKMQHKYEKNLSTV